jgi:hypothetical protein
MEATHYSLPCPLCKLGEVRAQQGAPDTPQQPWLVEFACPHCGATAEHLSEILSRGPLPPAAHVATEPLRAPSPDYSNVSFFSWLFSYLRYFAVMGIGFIALGKSGVPPAKAAWVATGLGVIYLPLRQPWWFWHDPRVVNLRGSLGNRGVQLLYMGIGLAALGMGLFTDHAFIQR